MTTKVVLHFERHLIDQVRVITSEVRRPADDDDAS
jgi:hypothetical protein